jgi:excisionase family DNA binding protein
MPQDTILLGERSSSAATPAPIDPVPAGLRDDVAELLARLLELQNKIAAQKEDGEPAQTQAPPANDAPVRVYTVSEVAKLLRLGLSRTYQHLEEGLIPALKIGGRWLIPHQALVRFLEDRLRAEQKDRRPDGTSRDAEA